MVDLYVRLPKVGQEGEPNPLQVLQGLVHVHDPLVLPLDPQVHGEGDAGLLVTDLHNVMVSLETGQQDNIGAWPGLKEVI